MLYVAMCTQRSNIIIVSPRRSATHGMPGATEVRKYTATDWVHVRIRGRRIGIVRYYSIEYCTRAEQCGNT